MTTKHYKPADLAELENISFNLERIAKLLHMKVCQDLRDRDQLATLREISSWEFSDAV